MLGVRATSLKQSKRSSLDTEVFSLRGPRFWIEPVHNRIIFDSSLKVQLLGCFTILMLMKIERGQATAAAATTTPAAAAAAARHSRGLKLIDDSMTAVR